MQFPRNPRPRGLRTRLRVMIGLAHDRLLEIVLTVVRGGASLRFNRLRPRIPGVVDFGTQSATLDGRCRANRLNPRIRTPSVRSFARSPRVRSSWAFSPPRRVGWTRSAGRPTPRSGTSRCGPAFLRAPLSDGLVWAVETRRTIAALALAVLVLAVKQDLAFLVAALGPALVRLRARFGRRAVAAWVCGLAIATAYAQLWGGGPPIAQRDLPTSVNYAPALDDAQAASCRRSQ